MRSWTFLLGGLLVWAAHFFLIYGIASIFLTSLIARLLAGSATAIAFAADIWLVIAARQRIRTSHERLARWLASLGLLAAALSMVAVAWQGLAVVLA